LSALKICPVCSTEYPANERFCPRDGTALRSQSSSTDLVGTIIAERYHIIKKLGEGGMGQVYLAEHVKMGRKSAVKVMNPGMVQNVDAISRFNREAQNASRINHPNVAGIYDFGETAEGLVYLAMEFVEGKPLTDVIKEHGALPPLRASEIARQTAEGLSIAHDMGIVHRDLKPDNIMIAKGRSGADLVKVVDFGIAKAAASDEQKVTKTGMVVGTPEYMSPEQLSGDPLDARSDIYALALVTFNMLTGTLPFPGESMQETMIMRLTDDPKPLGFMKPDVPWPADLQAVMDKALARDANKRYRNASEYATDLVQAIDRMPTAQSITQMGTQVVAAPMTSHEAATAATLQVQVPKTRVADKDDVVPAPGQGGRPAGRTPASPAATPTKSKAPLFGGLGLVAAAGIGFFVWKSQTTVPPAATSDSLTPPVTAPADSATQAPVNGVTVPQGTNFNNPIASAPDRRVVAETDSALAALNGEAELASSDDAKTLVLRKLDPLKSRLSTADQRVLAAIIESMAQTDPTKACDPLRKVQADLRGAKAKTASDFGILFGDCKDSE
jgi:serine/threonine-protein kinase